MNKKFLSLSLLLILLPLVILGSTRSALGVNVPIGTPGHYIIESIGDPETVDPAWAYDTASEALISNIYETLIEFDREHVNQFLPCLSTEVPSYANGLIQDIDEPAPHGLFNWKQRVTFPIRVGIPFHSGDTLTTEDVEYTFEKWMVQDRSGGPEWMIYEPVEGIGYYHAFQLTEDPVVQGQVIDQAFESNATHFWMNLAVRYPPIIGILAQPWGSIVNKSFMASIGDWNGDFATWTDYWNPPEAPVDAAGHVADGTGPFALGYDFGDGPGYWTVGVEWSIVRFPSYWGGWPYEHASGFLDRATSKLVFEWGTRLADFRAGRCDTAYVPRQYISQVDGWPGIRGLKDLPSLSADAMFFNFAIDPASPYVGTGVLGSGGIPLNFFSDIHIRKGFAYVLDYTQFLQEQVWLNEAVQPSSPIKEGVPYHNPGIPKYYMDIAKATEEFQTASDDPTSPAYQVMSKGFYMKIIYNTGNQPRQAVAQMIKTNLKLVNQLFNVETLGVTWTTLLGELWWYPSFRSVMPLYIMGWQADYPDPHDWIMPFMHTYGYFAYPSSYSNPTVDALIEQGIATPDGPARQAIYDTLQLMYYQEIPSVMLAQPLVRRWERDWVQGWYYNLIHSGSAADTTDYPSTSGPDFYHMWEGLNGDIAGDGDVDAADWALVIYYWWDPPMVGLAGYYEPKADVGPPLMYILGMLPPPGISVGRVDILDLAVLNAHWAETAA